MAKVEPSTTNQKASQSAYDQPPLGESAQTGWRSHWDIGIIVVFVLTWLIILCVFALPLEGFTDEYDIVNPARDYLAGQVHEYVKYPSFSFYFFGIFFKLFGTFQNIQDSLHVARIVNYFLFIANILLLHAFLRSHFARLWALVGTILFTTLPWIIFSAMYVKTEGLLLCQLLFVLVVLGKLSDHPNSLRWHALAAIGAALSISTKLSPLPFILYVSNAIYLRFHGTRITTRAILTYAAVLEITVLATWRNLWIFDKVVASWKRDIYFLSGAGPWNALSESELSGFPYGRFSSFLTVTMPMALGLVGLIFLCSLFARSIPRKILWAFGGGNLVSLIIALSTTRLRLPHGFTPHIVFFLVAGISFLAWLGSRKPAGNPIFNSRLAWVLVAACLAQTGWQVVELPSLMSAMSHAKQIIRSRPLDKSERLICMYPIEAGKASIRHLSDKMRDPKSLRELISIRNPKELYVYSSYIDNMCKYSTQPTYRENCDFFYKELLPGKTAYRVEREDVIPWNGFFMLDTEFRHMSFFLFTRSS